MTITRQAARPVEPIVWRYPYDPSGNPKQVRFHSVKAKEKLFGGAGGGGKTSSMMAEVFWMAATFGVPVLILRRTFPGLAEIIQRFQAIIPEEIGKWNEQKKSWTLRNGGRIDCGNLDHETDVRKYAGREYALIAWDELTQFTEWQYRRMFHPLRVATSHPGYAAMEAAGIEPYYIAGTNPGEIGHSWTKSRFIDPAPAMTVWQPSPTVDEPSPGTRIFVPSSVSDNPYISPAYKRQLDSLPPDERRMIRDGDWDVYAGQMFGDFRREIHVVDPDDYPIPYGGIQKVMGVDYGLSNPFCALWGAIFPDDLIVIYRELYETDLLANEQAALILASEAQGERLPNAEIPVYLDPSAWAREPTSPKVESPHQPPRDSIAWHYKQAGLPVRRAFNDRLAGWAEVKRRLRVQPDGKPRVLIYNTCVNLIRTLPTLPRSKTNPEDVDTNAEDHAADTLRYTVTGGRRIPPHESYDREKLRKINQASALAALGPQTAGGGWRT